MMEVLGEHPRGSISKVTLGKVEIFKMDWLDVNCCYRRNFSDLMILGADPGLDVTGTKLNLL